MNGIRMPQAQAKVIEHNQKKPTRFWKPCRLLKIKKNVKQVF